ncbi:MAG: hypothetical protein HDT18_08660 [Oscillibacter sp.]|nr:hypothetical protein [Oscillibacter sp.]
MTAAHPPRLVEPDEPPGDTRTEAEKNQQKKESLDSLVWEFTQFIGQYRIKLLGLISVTFSAQTTRVLFKFGIF